MNKLDTIFDFLMFYNITYLCKLPNKLDRFFDFSIFLQFFFIFYKLLNRPDRKFELLAFSQFILYKIINSLKEFFYFLIFYTFIICNKLSLSNNYKQKIYITKILAKN